MEHLRTPDERFANLPDFPYEPHYVDIDGLRMAWVETGPADGEVVLMLHGEPTWGFTYRKVMKAVAAAGMRAVVPDLIGFGRSDKPTRREDYTFRRHVDWVRAFMEKTNLTKVNLLGQDWGGTIGLCLVAEHPEWFERVIMANTFLTTGEEKLPEPFFTWLALSQNVPELPIGKIVRGGCLREMSSAVSAAYDAPHPDETYKAGARQFPVLVPQSTDDPATELARNAWQRLRTFEKPFLIAFSEDDPFTAGAEMVLRDRIPGAKGIDHPTIKDAGHFLQEDRGEELAEAVISFIRAR